MYGLIPTVVIPEMAKYQHNNDNYYDEYAVIPLFVTYPGNLVSYQIDSVKKTGGNLNITMTSYIGGFTVVDGRCIFVEVKKDDIRGAVSVTVDNTHNLTPPPPPVLSPALEAQMIEDYMKHIEPTMSLNLDLTCVIVQGYYGTYSGCQVVFIDACWGRGFLGTDKEVTVAGRRFVFPDFGFFTKPLAVYKDRAFLPIDKAHAAGWITEEDVGAIWDAYNTFGLTRTLTYMDGDVVWHEIQDRYGRLIALPPSPKKEGFIFDGWYRSKGSSIRFSDLTLSANWKPVSVTLEVGQTFTVPHLLSGGPSGWICSVSPSVGIDVELSYTPFCCKCLMGNYPANFTFTAKTPGVYTVTLSHVDLAFIIFTPEELEELFPGIDFPPPFEEYTFTITVPGEPEPPDSPDGDIPFTVGGQIPVAPTVPLLPNTEIAGSYEELMYIMYMNLYGTTDANVPAVLLPWHTDTARYLEDGFFEENAVIPLFISYPNPLISNEIVSVVKDGGNLIITKNSYLALPDVPGGVRCIFIEVKKSDIRGVTSVTVENTKVYDVPPQHDPDPDFHDGNLLVMVAAGHVWTIDDFAELDLINAEQIAEFSASDRVVLLLHLTNPGKDNVLAAIELLNQRGDVIYAQPNHFGMWLWL
jgi:uncharacterized repeat protein (TIGR02543 family)